ncbi:HIG1 domain-containing protein [Candidatus Tisiphia endosymbiont of Beris chalybata]|uniref:HIG1 domain-containing protein n=1 Tax=Candidatus Tisiphia endosymbiont of Beris chalybata TaxID=3066262 RepID=UPI00312CA9F1
MLYIFIALSLTTFVLVIGLITMAIGGRFEKKFSSNLMSLRVLLQALTVCLLAFLYLSK